MKGRDSGFGIRGRCEAEPYFRSPRELRCAAGRPSGQPSPFFPIPNPDSPITAPQS
jgi:hypothetical protein